MKWIRHRRAHGNIDTVPIRCHRSVVAHMKKTIKAMPGVRQADAIAIGWSTFIKLLQDIDQHGGPPKGKMSFDGRALLKLRDERMFRARLEEEKRRWVEGHASILQEAFKERLETEARALAERAVPGLVQHALERLGVASRVEADNSLTLGAPKELN